MFTRAAAVLTGTVLALGLAGAAFASVASAAWAAPRAVPKPPPRYVHRPAQPLVIGHRGAAGERPEHTATGYRLAAQEGADYLEPDLVPTKDGYLVDRHDSDITQTTDVARHPEFASLKTTKTIDGVTTTGWFTTDFTFAQLETLRCVERIPSIRPKNTAYNGIDRISTFSQDIVQFENLSAKYHRKIGIVPEIKHSTYFASLGLPMEDRVLAILHKSGLDGLHPPLPTIIQSFEVGNLQYLHAHTSVPLMQLTAASGAPVDFVASGDPRTYADLVTPAGLHGIAQYASYLGPNMNQLVPRTASNALGTPTSLVLNAHRAGLLVTPYTFRNENTYLPTNYQRGSSPTAAGDAIDEYRFFFSLGVDGVFADSPDTAVEARKEWLAG